MSRSNSEPIIALASEAVLSSLLPATYQQHGPVLADALDFFVRSLPANRQSLLQKELAAPRLRENPIGMLLHVMHACPTLHKLGQVLARHPALSTELRTGLQTLESMQPKTPITELTQSMRNDIAEARSGRLRIADRALAEASVAVVIPFELNEVGHDASIRGVFKALKPGVEQLVEEELAIWGRLGAFLDEDCKRYGIPAIDYENTFEQIRKLLANEIHLDREQRNLASAAAFYAHAPSVRVPRVFWFSTPRITAMQWLDGVKVTDCCHVNVVARQRLARVIVESLIAGPFWSTDDQALFHADPHAGNLLVDHNGSLCILDWSLTGRLGKQERGQLMQAILGAAGYDASKIQAAIERLSISNAVDPFGLRACVDSALGCIRRGAMPGLTWLTRLLDDAVQSAGVRLGSDLLLFRKSLFTLEGVVHDVCNGFDIDQALLASAGAAWSRDWPGRSFAPPFAAGPSTHVSNAEVVSLAMNAPAAALRMWTDAWRDAMRGWHQQ